MLKKKYILFVLLCIPVVLNSCIFSSKKKPSAKLNSFFEVQKNYAEVLDEYAGGPKVTIVPINGIIYPIGTVLAQGTNSPITKKCIFSGNEVSELPFSQQPSINFDNNFNASAKMPGVVEKALGGFFGLAGNITKTKSMTLSYADLSSAIVDEDIMEDKLLSSECSGSVSGKKITVIRGHISGKLKTTSSSKIDVGADVKILESEGMKFKYDNKGGYELLQEESVPRFYVLCDVDMTGVERFREAAFEGAGAPRGVSPSLTWTKPEAGIIEKFDIPE